MTAIVDSPINSIYGMYVKFRQWQRDVSNILCSENSAVRLSFYFFDCLPVDVSEQKAEIFPCCGFYEERAVKI